MISNMQVMIFLLTLVDSGLGYPITLSPLSTPSSGGGSKHLSLSCATSFFNQSLTNFLFISSILVLIENIFRNIFVAFFQIKTSHNHHDLSLVLFTGNENK